MSSMYMTMRQALPKFLTIFLKCAWEGRPCSFAGSGDERPAVFIDSLAVFYFPVYMGRVRSRCWKEEKIGRMSRQ